MALETTDLFVIQRTSVNGSPLLKATAAELDDYVKKTLDEVTTEGNTTENDISVGNVTLAGGGGDTQALQKQEITSLISTISAPDLTPYVEKNGDTMTGQLTLPGGGGNTQAIQKQEVEALISAIPTPPDPDLTPYVEKAGSNMTGDLTLGTNKIELDASTGAADFESDVTANAFIGDGSQLTNLPDQVTGVYLPLTGGTLTGDLTAPKFIGDGSLLTNLPGNSAVDSVNGQTGVVSIGVEDLDDFAYYPAANQVTLVGPNVPDLGVPGITETNYRAIQDGGGQLWINYLATNTALNSVFEQLTENDDCTVGLWLTNQITGAPVYSEYPCTFVSFQPNTGSDPLESWVRLAGAFSTANNPRQGDYPLVVKSAFISNGFEPIKDGQVLVYDTTTEKWRPEDIGTAVDYLPLTGGDLTGPLTSTSSITADGDLTLNGTGNGEIFISANTAGAGGYYRQKLDAGVSGGIWRIMDSSGADMAVIHADGSSEFDGNITAAGSVFVGDWDPSIDSDGVTLDTKGTVFVQRPTTKPTNAIFSGNLGTTETVRINANGNITAAGDVTIGTASSSGDTNGTFIQQTGGDPGASGITVYQNGVASDEVFFEGKSNSSAGEAKTRKIALLSDGSITAARRLITGTNGSSPGTYGSFLGVSGGKTAQLELYSNTTGEAAIAIKSAPDASTTKTPRVTINHDGSATFTGTVTTSSNFNSSSDIRLKDNVKTLEGSLDKVKQLRGVEYDRIDSDKRYHQLGVIAQEIEKIYPDMVSKNSNEMKTVAYQQLIPVLIEAIKELSKEVETLKNIKDN